jgi:hypothetical protein
MFGRLLIRGCVGRQGICGRAGAVDYYLEPEVERMCGVCDMFRCPMPTAAWRLILKVCTRALPPVR